VSRDVASPPERFEAGPERQVFAEGETDLSFDVAVLGELLAREGVRVRPAGGCENVIAAARAFARAGGGPGFEGAECYAIVDRDHRGDDQVGKTWAGGAFAEGRVHLYWRCHEFDNHFLEPEFLGQSAYLRPGRTVEDLTAALVGEARVRVYLDAANLVLKALREELGWWDFREFALGEGDFGSLGAARASLVDGRPYAQLAERKTSLLATKALTAMYDANVALMLGPSDDAPLEFGRGEWLQRMEGGKLLGAVLHERFFAVRGSNGRDLTGLDLRVRVARDLMRRFDELAYRPQDLVEVRDYFRSTQPRRFGLTGTAGSPPSQ